jgi:high-affinity iron transporter
VGAGIVMLREGFEASLIVGIILAFLNRTGRRDAFLPVWLGAGAALLLSIVTATLLFVIGAELTGTSEKIFEGSAMLIAAGLLTWMIFWMRSQARFIKKELEDQLERALALGSSFGLALVAFVGVLREGVETALFLFGTVEGSNKLFASTAAAIGLTGAVLLGYLFYRGASRLDLRKFFTVTSVLLLAFAGWLLAQGLHEFAEAGVLPESGLILLGAFAALALPTLYFYLRPAKKAVAS